MKLILLIVTLMTGIGYAAPAAGYPKSPDAQLTKARFEMCQAFVLKANKAGIVNVQWTKVLPTVTVGPTYYLISFEEKQELADNVNCMVMAGEKNYIDFALLDWRTGKPVAQYHLGRLKTY